MPSGSRPRDRALGIVPSGSCPRECLEVQDRTTRPASAAVIFGASSREKMFLVRARQKSPEHHLKYCTAGDFNPNFRFRFTSNFTPNLTSNFTPDIFEHNMGLGVKVVLLLCVWCLQFSRRVCKKFKVDARAAKKNQSWRASCEKNHVPRLLSITPRTAWGFCPRECSKALLPCHVPILCPQAFPPGNMSITWVYISI